MVAALIHLKAENRRRFLAKILSRFERWGAEHPPYRLVTQFEIPARVRFQNSILENWREPEGGESELKSLAHLDGERWKQAVLAKLAQMGLDARIEMRRE